MHYNHLAISQASALEHFHRQIAEGISCEQNLDYDATNLCTFLAVEIAADVLRYGVENLKDRVETIIQMLPLKINCYRNIEQLYDATEALQVLKLFKKNLKYNFELRELIYNGYNLLSSNGVSELLSGLHHIAESTMRAPIYICESYTMSIFSINETLYLVDAHPVNADAGGKFTGLILSTERTNVDGLLHWIVRRLVLSNSKTYYQSISIIDLVEKNF